MIHAALMKVVDSNQTDEDVLGNEEALFMEWSELTAELRELDKQIMDIERSALVKLLKEINAADIMKSSPLPIFCCSETLSETDPIREMLLNLYSCQ